MTCTVPESAGKIRKINVLVPLFITVCTCAVAFLAKQAVYQMIFTCLLFILMAFLGFAKAGLKIFIWFMLSVKSGCGLICTLVLAFHLL